RKEDEGTRTKLATVGDEAAHRRKLEIVFVGNCLRRGKSDSSGFGRARHRCSLHVDGLSAIRLRQAGLLCCSGNLGKTHERAGSRRSVDAAAVVRVNHMAGGKGVAYFQRAV